MSERAPLHLFEAYGVELEYMIVHADNLGVHAITDRVLHAVAGEYACEIELGAISWSNELALHVLELKTTDPAPALEPLPGLFQEQVRRINGLLGQWNSRLMPAAMHPWMDPATDMRLWPHDYSPVYEAFNRIFDCRGHGWANLQSVHLNLPFQGDDEFGRLHAAIRLILPILPALAASSPWRDGRLTGLLDTRLDVYRNNSARIPSLTGRVIPEPVYTAAAYQHEILDRIYADIAPHDPEGTLQHEWLNARGAIARFERNAIEIRVLDVQECPQADVAICALIVAVLRCLTEEVWSGLAPQQAYPTEALAAVLTRTIRDADEAAIDDPRYLEFFGWPGAAPCSAADLWRHLVDKVRSAGLLAPTWGPPLQTILDQGPLARRIVRALGDDPPARLAAVARELCACLADGRQFYSA